MQKSVEELADVSEQFERQVLDKDLKILDVDSIEEEAKNSVLREAVSFLETFFNYLSYFSCHLSFHHCKCLPQAASLSFSSVNNLFLVNDE